MLHWACDRGHLDVVKFLVSRGADVNIQDPDLQTPLHYGKRTGKLCSYSSQKSCHSYSPFPCSPPPPLTHTHTHPPNTPPYSTILKYTAASCDQSEVVRYLLSVPAVNRTLKDCDGCLAVEVTSNTSIRQLFEGTNLEQ